VVFWDLGATLAGDQAVDPANVIRLPVDDDDNDEEAGQAFQKLQLDSTSEEEVDRPRTLFSVSHGAKPNWMVAGRGQDRVFPSTIFLADTTNDITAYTIPLQ
jgi:hypothetical protein